MFRIKPEGRGGSRGYSGKGSYTYIDGLIKGKGKTLKMISPFIGPSYAKMLVDQSGRKKIYVITAPPRDDNFGANQARSIAILKRVRMGIGMRLAAILAILAIALFLAGIYPIAIAIFGIAVLIFCISLYLYFTMKNDLELKVVKGIFIHEKLYIGDDMAITGSANLTEAGTHSNIEHIEIIDDKDRIKGLSRHFDELWNS